MQCLQSLRIVLAILALCVILVRWGVAEEGAAITWESYKDVELDFGNSLLRVASDYQAYAFATGEPAGWKDAHPDPELTIITDPITTVWKSAAVSADRATASAVAGWLLDKDDATGIAKLSNAAAGTTAVADKYDPTVVAMSWAAQSTTLELGEEVSQGVIDWSPGIVVTASGGAFLSSYDTISIHDPIVVWTRDASGTLLEPTTVFEVNAEFDSNTEIHWNDVRAIEAGIEGAPEWVPIANDGPFLNAGLDGSGSISIRLDSEFLPDSQRGSLEVGFKDGIVTSSSATGVFNDLAPVENDGPAALTGSRLPAVGSPAVIETILVDGDETNGRFVLDVDVGQDRVITDVAACSDGVHISVGAAVDTIQTFTLNPLQRSALQASAAAGATLDGRCLGSHRGDAELLFGTMYAPLNNASLRAESEANPIDRFLRLEGGADAPHRMIVFEPGENSSPQQTRRWTARFDVRLTDGDVPTPIEPEPDPIEPVEPVAVEPAAGFEFNATDEVVVGRRPRSAAASSIGAAQVQQLDAAQTNTSVAAAPRYAIGLVERSGNTDESTNATDGSVSDGPASLFKETDGIVLTVIDRPQVSIARVNIDGELVAEGQITAKHRQLAREDDAWQHFELNLEQYHEGIGLRLNLVDSDGRQIQNIIDEAVPKKFFSADGYQLALASLIESDDAVYDFDNLLTAFQQAGDVAWDGLINVDDFHLVSEAIVDGLGPSSADADLTISESTGGGLNKSLADILIADLDLNGKVDFADLELIEDLIPDKRPGDTNLDGKVNLADFLAMFTYYGTRTGLWSRGDFNSDGAVLFDDILLLARNFDQPDDQSESVAEPSGLPLLLIAAVAILRIRRRRLPVTAGMSVEAHRKNRIST